MGVMSTRARPQAVGRGIQSRISRRGGGFKSHVHFAEEHRSRGVLTSTFRRRPVGNRNRMRRAPAAGRGKAGPGTPGFSLWQGGADELLQGFSCCRSNVYTEECPSGRYDRTGLLGDGSPRYLSCATSCSVSLENRNNSSPNGRPRFVRSLAEHR